MKLYELSPASGASKKAYRRGRGTGSGNGKTAGKGHKGQNARSGGGTRPGFEGGQMPLYRRLPKRGFTNALAKKYAIINIKDLEKKFEDGMEINTQSIIKSGIVKKVLSGVKLLGNGELSKKFKITLAAFSETAKNKVEKTGGRIEVE